MATAPLYVPVLKGKEGEFAALEALKPDPRTALMPLIEIPPVPIDYSGEGPGRSIDQHVSGLAERLRRCWGPNPLYLDLPWFEGGEEHLQDGRLALEVVLSDCLKAGVQALPVISRANSHAYIAAAARHSATSGLNVCIRLVVADFQDDIDLEADIGGILARLGRIDPSSIDLVIDLEDLGTDEGKSVLVARSILSMLPQALAWRRMILAATSFPEDLSDLDPSTVTSLPRREWDLWKALQKRPERLPRRDMIFGDYAIAHPVPRDIDPRVMLMSANIRYTADDNWLIIKGRNVRQYGFNQYFELCKILVNRPEYRSADFSWGDQYIADCAEGMAGPGNATTWRKVGTNHHLTLVAWELAKLRRAA